MGQPACVVVGAGDGLGQEEVVRLDCTLDTPGIREYYPDIKSEAMANTDDVAETYYWIHRQPRSAWSNEVELRPYTEDWTY